MDPRITNGSPASGRLEDFDLLTGRAEYTGDLKVPGLHHVSFVRSTQAHAEVSSVDLDVARGLPGVAAAYGPADFGTTDIRAGALSDLLPAAVLRPAIANGRVRFVGEIVAAVVADSQGRAADAAGAVEVEYDPVPAVVDVHDSVRSGAELLFPDLGTNVVLDEEVESGRRDPLASTRIHHVLANPRMAVAPMEGNAITVIPDHKSAPLLVYASTQTPHALRDQLANLLGWAPEEVRVVTPAVGGGFGGKVYLSPEYAITALAALRLGIPLRWVQLRGENLMTMQGRDHLFEISLEATSDGRLTGLDMASWTNAGAYPGFGCHIAMTARTMAPGPYNVAYLKHRLRCVATNTAPTGAFRGAGRPEATHALERGMDMLAAELGLDPAEIRRRNLLAPDQFPFETATGAVYDSGDYGGALDRALQVVGYADLRATQAERRRSGSRSLLGIGLSTYVELSAAAPGIDGEYAEVVIDSRGCVTVAVGTAAHGQGHRTIFTNLLADLLRLPATSIQVIDGDTQRVVRGAGTGGSRSGQVGGSAVLLAGRAVLAKARDLAAHLLEAAVEDLEIMPGVGLNVRGTPAAKVTWGELAIAATDPDRLPPGMEPGLRAAPGFQMAPGGTAPFGCHVALVEVDAETGAVCLLRLVAVDDCGQILNPVLATGQVHGGVAAGIGQALFEQIRYDAHGNPLNPSFAEYLMPSAADLPSYETAHTVTPTSKNPLGAKGIGEAGTTGSLAAVHNAVVDALAHLGVRHLDLPITPERIWRAMGGAGIEPSTQTATPPAPTTTPSAPTTTPSTQTATPPARTATPSTPAPADLLRPG